MQQNKPIVRNGVVKDQHIERIVGEHISFTHIVSYDNISDSININMRVNDIDMRHLGRRIEILEA